MRDRKEALSQVKLNIFSEITENLESFSSFSPAERLQFIERAFNNVNEYYSNIFFGLDPNNTKFGFMTGSNNQAVAFNVERAIGYDIGHALLINNPMAVYKAMFHEFRHIWHFNASLSKAESPYPMGLVLESHSISRKLPKPIFKAVDTILQPASLVTMTLMKPFNLINKACFYKNSKSGYSYASHEASLNEIEADNSAYSNMAKVFKEGILKSTNPDLAQQLLKLNEDSRKINNQGHSKALISSLPFNRLHTKPKEQSKATFAEKVGQIDDEMYFFSTTQALQVIERNPDAFKTRKDTILSGIKLFKGYAQEHGAKRHVSQNFFGTFFPFNYNRYFKDPEYARYDNQGKLIDKEELSILGLEQVQPEQDENVDFNLSRQEEGQIIRNSKVTSIIRDDSLEEVYSLTTQYGEEHEDNQNDSCFDIIKNNLISNRLQNKQSHTEEDNFKDLLNDCCEIQPDNGPTQQ